MRNAKSLLLVAAGLIAGGAHAQELDTAKLDELRSAVAEAAAIGDAEAGGKITHVYADGIRQDIRGSLEPLLRAPGLGAVAGQALVALDRRDQATLLTLRRQLVATERAHGRAD